MNEIYVNIDGEKKKVEIVDSSKIIIDGKENSYELLPLDSKSFLLNFNRKIYKVSAENPVDNFYSIIVNGIYFEAAARTALEEKADAILLQKSVARHKTDVKAPMPGMILKVKKNSGDNVVQGETLIILEAMKMENDLRSPASGIVKEVYAAAGSKVEKGALLLSIE